MSNWWQAPVTETWNPPIEYGEDLGVNFHTPITALQPGTVVGAAYHGWGGEVDIASSLPGVGPVTEYVLHLDQITPGLGVGSKVAAGDVLGLSGGQLAGGLHPNDPQFSTGPHVEAGFFVGGPWSGKSVNPAALIAAGPASGAGGPSLNPVDWITQAIQGAVAGGSNVVQQVPAAAGQAEAIALAPALAIAGGLGAIANAVNPANVGHGLADAAVATQHNLGAWFNANLVAFAVAAVVLLVLFLG